MASTTWGFVGFDKMGYAMAKTQYANMPVSDTLIIFDTNHKALECFSEATKESPDSCTPGRTVEIAKNGREVAERSNIIITCLPNPEMVKELFYSIREAGILAPLKQDRLFIDSSTIDPASAREVAIIVHNSLGGRFIDAPASGGAIAARAGTLSFRFGAPSPSEDELDQIKSVLSMMGDKVRHVGGQGTGVASKLASNYILAVHNVAAAEALHIGVRWGLDPKLLTDRIHSSRPRKDSHSAPDAVKDEPMYDGYEAGGTLAVINRNLRLTMARAKERGIRPVSLGKAYETWQLVDSAYHGKDLSDVYKWLQDRSTVQSMDTFVVLSLIALLDTFSADLVVLGID